MYTLYFYGSPDYKNRVTRKFKLQKMFEKKKFRGFCKFVNFLWNFFCGGGVPPPPPLIIYQVHHIYICFIGRALGYRNFLFDSKLTWSFDKEHLTIHRLKINNLMIMREETYIRKCFFSGQITKVQFPHNPDLSGFITWKWSKMEKKH